MKRIVKVIVIMIITAMIMGIVNVSNAFSFNANLSSNDKLVAGQEVKITLSLSGINMDDGIRSIKVGKITVGEEFEPVTSANFTSSNTWMPTYANGGLILMSGTPVKSEGVAVTLTLKVKSGVTAKSSTIKFENIVASSGSNTGDISEGTKTITVKANEPAISGNESGTTNPSTNTNGTQNGTNQATEKNTSNTTKKTTSSQAIPSKLPKAGDRGTIVILSLILMITVLGIVSLVKYKKVK